MITLFKPLLGENKKKFRIIKKGSLMKAPFCGFILI